MGSFAANRLGIFDLAGNVYEYCDGWYRKEMNPELLRKLKPSLKEDGGGEGYRFMRGGSWADSHPVALSLGYREGTRPDLRFDNRGFRCVLVVQPQAAR